MLSELASHEKGMHVFAEAMQHLATSKSNCTALVYFVCYGQARTCTLLKSARFAKVMNVQGRAQGGALLSVFWTAQN